MKNLTPVSVFSTPVQAPEDMIDNVVGATVEQGLQALLNRTEYLKDNKVTKATSSTDSTLPRFDGTTGDKLKAGTVVQSDDGTLSAVKDIHLSGEVTYTGGPKARKTYVPASKFVLSPDLIAGGGTSYQAYGMIWANESNQRFVCQVDELLPVGAFVTRIQAMVNPAGPRPSSQRTAFAVTGTVVDIEGLNPGTPVFGDIYFSEDDGTTNLQNYDTGDFAWAVNRNGKALMAQWQSGDQAAIAGTDIFYGMLIYWTDPGPING